PEQKRTGGGGGGGKYCFEKWVCDDWELCQNLKRSFDIKMISENDYYDSNEICAQEKYDEKSCGFQLRNCADLENCSNQIFRVKKPVEYQICYFTENPDCQDGIKNCHDDGCELLVDCGGPCGVCPTCSDKIQNQGEFGIDCGGPCPYSCEKEIPLLFNWMFLLLILLLILTLMFILLKLRKIRQYKKDED
ncbi:MAG: hypothetical protein Q8N88_02830, partial [Nanoarchaeota archaeon]|nr:hypothetical protein [Nanoarchaeota archaeon]